VEEAPGDAVAGGDGAAAPERRRLGDRPGRLGAGGMYIPPVLIAKRPRDR
jgi:hypothetical protein